MESGDWDLTLFTCTTGGQSRITVRCVLKDS
jgi:sortase A